MKKNYLKKTILLVVTIILTCNYLWAYDGSGTIVSASITRSFRFHSPGTSVASNLPVMLVFHGDGGTGASIESYTGMDATADANNFIAVYPDAIGGLWNEYADTVPGDAGRGNLGAADDVLFISDLIDYFCFTYRINSNKVYATGHSAGGFMCYDLAVFLPDKIAAFAPVSASLWGDSTFLANYFSGISYVHVPIYHIHGDADATVDYPDLDHIANSWGEWPLWSFSYPNCGADTYTSTTNIVAGVNRLTFCGSSKEVYLIQIVGGGHVWPNVSGYSTNDAIWNFCNAYTISTVVNCASGIKENENNAYFSISPNPSNGKFNIKIAAENGVKEIGTLEIYNILGEKVYSINNLKNQTSNEIDLSNVQQGIYCVKIYHNEKIYIEKIVIE
jgi:poly(3-hydroxybutyrate) depolymerase